MTLATEFMSPPATGIALPMRLSHFLTLVRSYSIFGHAVRIMETIAIAVALLMKIWFGTRPVIMA